MKKLQAPAINESGTASRREFLARSGKAVAAAALAGVTIPHVHAAGDNTIRLALIGCGNRGSGALANAMEAGSESVKLVAMADLYENRLLGAHQVLTEYFGSRVDVPKDRQFLGFDAFKRAIDSLRPGSGDIAMLTGYAGFRPQQLEYAVQKGVNVFMEKSFATDPPGVRRVIAAGEEAEKKGVKIAGGMNGACRFQRWGGGHERLRILGRLLSGKVYESFAGGQTGAAAQV